MIALVAITMTVRTPSNIKLDRLKKQYHLNHKTASFKENNIQK
jgi:hypothetical protein